MPLFQVLGVYESQAAMSVSTQVRRMSKALPVAILVLSGALFSFRKVSRLLVVYFAALN